MAIDTVKLRSPSIDAGLASFLESQCILKSGVDLSTGEVLYEITTGELEGSWDSRISFQVKREEWKTVGGRLDLYPCAPYILLECSWHKVLHGQNVYQPRAKKRKRAVFSAVDLQEPVGIRS